MGECKEVGGGYLVSMQLEEGFIVCVQKCVIHVGIPRVESPWLGCRRQQETSGSECSMFHPSSIRNAQEQCLWQIQ